MEPGEIVITDTKTGELRSIKDHCGRPDRQMCVFEFIYFARPDSVIEGSSVHEARKQAGRFLAQEHPVEADVVIGVPDSGLDAALGYSQESGIPYGIGFIKNKYIGRTFIQGSQKQRENSVRIKLNVVTSTVKGKASSIRAASTWVCGRKCTKPWADSRGCASGRTSTSASESSREDIHAGCSPVPCLLYTSNEGETIEIDTRDGSYVSRVKA